MKRLRDDETLRNSMCIWYPSCPCSNGGCVGLPDEGCYVYRWFKKLILDDIADAAKKMLDK